MVKIVEASQLAITKKFLNNPALTNIVAFHAQQANEKSSKAILIEKENARSERHS